MSNNSEPKTFPELLDAAQTGQEFGDLIQALFWSLEPIKEDNE